MGGFRAFLDATPLDPATTFVLGLDTLGAGTPILARAEGALRTHHYRPADLALVDAAARRMGEQPPQRWRKSQASRWASSRGVQSVKLE